MNLTDPQYLVRQCLHVDDERCTRIGKRVVRWPHGRRTSAAYCPLHGGEKRALQDIDASWNARAPASVGDAQAVQDAGLRGWQHSYNDTSLRWVPELVTEQWHAVRRGIPGGSRTFMTRAAAEAYAESVPDAEIRHRRHVRLAHWVYAVGTYGQTRELGTAATKEEALSQLEAWRQRMHEEDVATITKARGGDLHWGLPIPKLAPLDPAILNPVPQVHEKT